MGAPGPRHPGDPRERFGHRCLATATRPLPGSALKGMTMIDKTASGPETTWLARLLAGLQADTRWGTA